MVQISFACPLCDGCFSKRIDHAPNGAVIEFCPSCRGKIELSSDYFTGETAVHDINLTARRLSQ